jgi:hypothetical protein
MPAEEMTNAELFEHARTQYSFQDDVRDNLERTGLKTQRTPQEEFPSLPEDLGDFGGDQLGHLMAWYSTWANFLSGEVIRLQVEVRALKKWRDWCLEYLKQTLGGAKADRVAQAKITPGFVEVDAQFESKDCELQAQKIRLDQIREDQKVISRQITIRIEETGQNARRINVDSHRRPRQASEKPLRRRPSP